LSPFVAGRIAACWRKANAVGGSGTSKNGQEQAADMEEANA
jgi:hypothetical protein